MKSCRRNFVNISVLKFLEATSDKKQKAFKLENKISETKVSKMKFKKCPNKSKLSKKL